MASSGTEVHWSEPGLGKGPPRRRWTWAKEEKDACGGGPHSWGAEEPFPSATSPELLEDFCRAQQHLQPRQWDSEPQPDGHQGSGSESGSESGESAEEEFEAEDVDSPESSNLPPDWLPQQGPPPGMTEEEPEEALGDDEAGESSPRSEYEASLCSGDDGTTSPVALGWGHATSWVASGKQASGDELPEHSEVNPTVDLSSAKSWSSGTMSLGHPSDSLDSTWEGETGVPRPTALEETSPQSPSHHLLNPDDRTGGGVALATPTEFQDSSVPPAQSLQSPADRWRRGAASLSCPQPGDHSWKRARISPKALPSRFTGSISRLSPPPRPAPQDRPRRPGATVAGRSSSDAPNYGRGRLNYPLPDFSKVGPRVRFPKEDSYHPPKARRHSRQPQDPIRPLIFKSPAEIVQEVLLSSGEACMGKDPPPAHPITRVPQEFQTPEQATKLVHQLQEDYHKLLTKYAEAENTIDQLRLGAKVNLYSDPPKPSHSIHTGMVSQGTKVLTFTIPHPHSVQRWPGPAEAPQTSEASGCLPENPGIAPDQAPAQGTQELASQARRFLAKVESFVGLMQAGRLTPQDQLKVFQQLKAAHSALEEEYLKACREQHPAQRLAGSTGAPGKFDPGRELEAEIFQLGIRLEELKDHMEQNQQKLERAGSDSPLDSPLATPSRHRPTRLPSPLGQAHTPAVQTLGLEPDAPSTDPCSLHMNVEVSPAGSEVEDRLLGLPAPLRHKELQVEQDFHGFLERYLSVKSLPEAMRAEEEGEEEEQGRTLEVDGSASAPGKAQTTRLPSRQLPVRVERTHGTPLEEAVGQSVSVKAAGFHASMAGDGHQLGLGQAEAAPPGPGRPPHSRGTKPAASHQSSLTSLEGSGISERLAQKSLRQAGGHLEVVAPGSQLEGRKRISEQFHPSTGSSPASTQGPAAAALPHGPADSTSTLLTRTGRDQAIRELQEEVSRLRLRLEDSLHQLPQGSPTQPASTFNHSVRARDRPTDSPAAWGIHYGSKSTERLCSEPGGAESPVPAGRRRARSSSVPREVPRLSLSSESEPSSPRLSSPKGRITMDSPQAARDKTRRMRSTGRVTFRGQYTGGAVAKDPLGPSPTDAPRCPLCGQAGSPGSPAEGDGPDAATSGAGKSTRRNAPSASSPKQRSKRVGSPPAPPPGLWYLAAAPSGPAPPAFAYISSLPVMPYPSATVFYAPPGGPTSAPTTPSARPAAEWPPAASSRAAGGHRRSIQLDLEDLEELNKALSRAVQAAESVRATTKHMSRSLSADLCQAHSLRGSCLF
ncbi:AT-hook-containing transcription factor [Myotis davidii]|uniref:AT-hook-containing transcription factor n=1 Tax=Myotis davidii TaxID=225400 RepID=L5LAK0_MYODS|nr:AT-hook-containing transcription factor [Myotis davidii]